MKRPDSIRLQWRGGRNVFVFQRDGSDIYELEELPPRFIEDPADWVDASTAEEEPIEVPKGESWSRLSITGLRRTLTKKTK